MTSRATLVRGVHSPLRSSLLVLGTDGNFYGTTYEGGSSGSACFTIEGCGAFFKLTPNGTLTTLYTFCATTCADGAFPSVLIEASDGNFYGTTEGGGANSDGTVFRLSPSGVLTTPYIFCSEGSCIDGSRPDGLMQSTDGSFYGTTATGGIKGVGSVFSLGVGLGQFVQTLPASGKVGAEVTILGTNLTGATAVSFHGSAAAFTVVSATEITTTIPVGATTGAVTVTTPSGTLKSNIAFRVP